MNQTEIFDDKKFQCEMHPEQSMNLICYSEKCPYKRRLLCLCCILEGKKELDNIASLQDFIKDPISILNKARDNGQSQSYQFEELLKKIEECENMIQQVQKNILQQLASLKVQIQTLGYDLQQCDQSLLRTLVSQFQKQQSLVWKMDSYQGTQEFSLLEQQLNNIIISWKGCCETEVDNFNNKILFNIEEEFIIQMKDSFQLEKTIYDNILQSLQQISNQQPEIATFIHKEISKGRTIKYNLLYHGNRDGFTKDQLTVANYWQKCHQQSHLLTIITLKNGNVFGGYSPCQLAKVGTYVADNTYQSFIFQQNKQEIYKLRDKDKAILCRLDYGPIFGEGYENDFWVETDFKSVGSNLGHTYDISGYNVQNKNTHLIGDIDREIVECNIYKILFL